MRTEDKTDREIRRLGSFCIWVYDRYQDTEDKEGAELLIEIVGIQIQDLRRQQKNVIGSLRDLISMKKGVRLAGVLLQAIQDGEPDQMRGWRYRQKPLNRVQAIYELVMSVTMRLTVSISEAEDEFPNMRAEFDAEREEYRRSLESDPHEAPAYYAELSPRLTAPA